jgi:hypothetical protein
MADVAKVDMTPGEVRAAVMRLGLLREGIEGQVAKYVEVVTALYRGRAWIADGTGSWEAFAVKHGVPVNLPRDERQAVSVALSETGMSTRAIAATQGVSQPQTVRDLAGAGDTSRITSTIEGIDGKAYTRPAPAAPRRSSLPHAYGNAVHELSRAVDRFERLSTDDRFRELQDRLHAEHGSQVRELTDRLLTIATPVPRLASVSKLPAHG